jgi:tellurite resistance protein TerC
LVFHLFLIFALALDLGVFHRGGRAVSFSNALIWSGLWALLAVVFGLGMYQFRGPEIGVAFFTGYLLEWSLSVDNLFVFLSVFSFFAVPAAHQHRVLFWGILGALVMRGVFIFLGVAVLGRFHWIMYLFGGMLLFTGARLAWGESIPKDPRENFFVRLLMKWFPFTTDYHGGHFWVYQGRKRVGTPLLLALVVIEVTDLIFAMDSIPAVLGITTDPFVVYTSNVFAILGLRSLYFALSGMMSMFRFLRFGLAGILLFIGAKLCVASWISIPTFASLGVIAGFLVLSILASLSLPSGEKDRQ